MPRRELKFPSQVEKWLTSWGEKLKQPGELILIDSGALLWHAAQRGIETPLPENSMDVDPITRDEEIVKLSYEAHIGSPFEQEHGWHINPMPEYALRGLKSDWAARSVRKQYGQLTVVVPSAPDLLVPKLIRGEPRDLSHAAWAREIGLC
jgi:hypothetical protein